jgi:hypothetical protein
MARSVALLVVAVFLATPSVAVAESPSCLSPSPADWPAASKPYFMVIADTSGSMSTAVGSPAVASSCGFGTTRNAHLRCALRDAMLAHGGRVNFGLAGYARLQANCGVACFTSCTYADYPNNATGSGCGPGTGTNRRGAVIRVPVLQDSFWTSPPPTSNLTGLLSWVDNACLGNAELFADGLTPLNGALRDMKRYFSATGWTAQDNSVTYPSPLASQDLAGTGVNSGTGCRSVNVILIADGDESCDAQADAVAAASDLFQNGVTVGGNTFKVRVFVVNFAGGTATSADAIAAAGGTGSSYFVTNEAELSQALGGILSRANPVEVGDNRDNDCNGCTDEGLPHYCHVSSTCCASAMPGQRDACLANHAASITPANPHGDPALLPCTSVAQASSPATWLTVDPGDRCDDVDNNCSGGIDEGQRQCGDPPHCPQAEVCNGQDDNCDGQVDEGNVCALCTPSAEVCNGCDDDCDGVVDNGLSPVVPCGFAGPAEPASCQGTRTCRPPQPVAQAGMCVLDGGFTACTFPVTPQVERCDGLDNDCDGAVDEGIAFTACVPSGTPADLVYGGTSRCRMGAQQCGACQGFVGPAPETCNGVDDDCDGVVDDGVTDSLGHAAGAPCCPWGGRCGAGACAAGTWTCDATGSVLTCGGGVGPAAETCNGVDDDCNGLVDDVPNLGAECSPAPGRLDCDLDAGTLECFAAMVCVVDAGAGDGAGGGAGGGDVDAGAGGGGADAGGGGADAGSGAGGGTGGGGAEATSGCGCQSTDAGWLFGLTALLPLVSRRRRQQRARRATRTGWWLPHAVLALTLLFGCTERPSARGVDSTHQAVACIDSCGDTQTDPNHCGHCNHACALVDATSACRGGQCVVASCTPGKTDLDGDPSNGCEASCAGDGAVERCDGLDNDCDGLVDEGYDLQHDVHHCGSCGNDCAALAPTAIASCVMGTCAAPVCPVGTWPAGSDCITCTPTGPEVCNGIDDDCDGLIDDSLTPPSTSQVCGVSPVATAPECTTQVNVACVMGGWRCTFPTGVCTDGDCAGTPEVCDALDNNCDGRLNENVPRFGQSCASDEGLPPPGHGGCRTTGTYACSGPSSVACSAVKADCSTLPGGCAEACDGVDNDCDGLVDEPFSNKGSNPASFVTPVVTRVSTTRWVFSYEASRPSATTTASGTGNGYVTSAPTGATLDKTPACSVGGKVPWFNVTPREVEQVCSAMGGFVCATSDYQTACQATMGCSWGYNPRGAACTAAATASKRCNLGPTYDFNAGTAGDQDGLLPTASPLLQSCWADWSGLEGNSTSTNKVFDVTGNLREVTKSGTNTYPLMGGSYLSGVESGASCPFASLVVDEAFASRDTGFRCCFSADPAQ